MSKPGDNEDRAAGRSGLTLGFIIVSVAVFLAIAGSVVYVVTKVVI